MKQLNDEYFEGKIAKIQYCVNWDARNTTKGLKEILKRIALDACENQYYECRQRCTLINCEYCSARIREIK